MDMDKFKIDNNKTDNQLKSALSELSTLSKLTKAIGKNPKTRVIKSTLVNGDVDFVKDFNNKDVDKASELVKKDLPPFNAKKKDIKDIIKEKVDKINKSDDKTTDNTTDNADTTAEASSNTTDRMANPQLVRMSDNINMLKRFNLEITNAYYRKSLELQYMSLFTARNQLEVLKAGMNTFKDQLEAIVNNTSLTDGMKRDKTIRGIISEYHKEAKTAFIKRTYGKIEDKVLGRVIDAGKQAYSVKPPTGEKAFVNKVKNSVKNSSIGKFLKEENLNKIAEENGVTSGKTDLASVAKAMAASFASGILHGKHEKEGLISDLADCKDQCKSITVTIPELLREINNSILSTYSNGTAGNGNKRRAPNKDIFKSKPINSNNDIAENEDTFSGFTKRDMVLYRKVLNSKKSKFDKFKDTFKQSKFDKFKDTFKQYEDIGRESANKYRSTADENMAKYKEDVKNKVNESIDKLSKKYDELKDRLKNKKQVTDTDDGLSATEKFLRKTRSMDRFMMDKATRAATGRLRKWKQKDKGSLVGNIANGIYDPEETLARNIAHDINPIRYMKLAAKLGWNTAKLGAKGAGIIGGSVIKQFTGYDALRARFGKKNKNNSTTDIDGTPNYIPNPNASSVHMHNYNNPLNPNQKLLEYKPNAKKPEVLEAEFVDYELTPQEEAKLKFDFFNSFEYREGIIKTFNEYKRALGYKVKDARSYIESMLDINKFKAKRDEILNKTKKIVLERLNPFLKTLTPEEEEALKEQFFESPEYKNGSVTDFNEYKRALGYKSKINYRQVIENVLRKTRALDRKAMVMAGKGLVKGAKLFGRGVKLATKTGWRATRLGGTATGIIAGSVIKQFSGYDAIRARMEKRRKEREAANTEHQHEQDTYHEEANPKLLENKQKFIEHKPKEDKQTSALTAIMNYFKKKDAAEKKPREGDWKTRLKSIVGDDSKDKSKGSKLRKFITEHKGLSTTAMILGLLALGKSMGITMEDVKGFVKGVVSGLGTVKDVLVGIGKVIGKVYDVTKWVGTKIMNIGSAIGTGLGKVINAILPTGVMKKIKSWFGGDEKNNDNNATGTGNSSSDANNSNSVSGGSESSGGAEVLGKTTAIVGAGALMYKPAKGIYNVGKGAYNVGKGAIDLGSKAATKLSGNAAEHVIDKVGVKAAETAVEAGGKKTAKKGLVATVKIFLNKMKTTIVKKMGKAASAKLLAKIASRFVPFAGAALLAYDATQIGYDMLHNGTPFKNAVSKQILGFDIFENDNTPQDKISPEKQNKIDAEKKAQAKSGSTSQADQSDTNGTKKSFMDKVNDAKNSIVGGVKSFAGTTSSIFSSIFNKTGDALHSAGTAIAGGYNKVVSASKSALDAAKGLIGKGISAVSSYFESSKAGGAGAIGGSGGDYGGASYGKYQLASNPKINTLGNYLANSKYGKEFQGLTPGSSQFNAKWKEIAAKDPTGFEKDQEQFITATHYIPLVNRLKKIGLDVNSRSKALQSSVFATSVALGSGTKLIQNALVASKLDPTKASDKDIIDAIYKYKEEHNDSLYRSSSPNIKASLYKRVINEHAMVLKMLESEKPNAATNGKPTDGKKPASATATTTPVKGKVAPKTEAVKAAVTPTIKKDIITPSRSEVKAKVEAKVNSVSPVAEKVQNSIVKPMAKDRVKLPDEYFKVRSELIKMKQLAAKNPDNAGYYSQHIPELEARLKKIREDAIAKRNAGNGEQQPIAQNDAIKSESNATANAVTTTSGGTMLMDASNVPIYDATGGKGKNLKAIVAHKEKALANAKIDSLIKPTSDSAALAKSANEVLSNIHGTLTESLAAQRNMASSLSTIVKQNKSMLEKLMGDSGTDDADTSKDTKKSGSNKSELPSPAVDLKRTTYAN